MRLLAWLKRVESSEGMDWLLEEVVVTAQKREQRLIDVPMSISVVDSKMIESRGIQNFTDLSYAVPKLISSGTGVAAIKLSQSEVLAMMLAPLLW